MPIREYPGFTDELVDNIEQKIRDRAYRVIDTKKSTYFAIGFVISKIVSALRHSAHYCLCAGQGRQCGRCGHEPTGNGAERQHAELDFRGRERQIIGNALYNPGTSVEGSIFSLNMNLIGAMTPKKVTDGDRDRKSVV